MRVVEGVAVGTGGCVAAEAMLIEVLNNSRVRQRVIPLERQQIIAAARQDPLGNRGLTPMASRVTMLFARANWSSSLGTELVGLTDGNHAA